MEIQHTNDSQEIIRLRELGFEPIECSIGGKSIVGNLQMDHHGDLSHLTGVAVRAYNEHYGARRDDPRFVVTGSADADACFAIAALAGLLPHPSNAAMMEGKPWLKGMDADITPLAELVNLVDTAPIGVRLEVRGDEGAKLLLFNQSSVMDQDALSFYSGVDRWRWLAKSPSIDLLAAAIDAEQSRVLVARQAEVVLRSLPPIAIVKSDAWGFDVWYADHAPVVVAITPNGNITVGVKNEEVAAKLFGDGGLKNVFPLLTPEGWGGREAIGGSPRGMKMTWANALATAEVLGDYISEGNLVAAE